jgi:hypothetical protein
MPNATPTVIEQEIVGRYAADAIWCSNDGWLVGRRCDVWLAHQKFRRGDGGADDLSRNNAARTKGLNGKKHYGDSHVVGKVAAVPTSTSYPKWMPLHVDCSAGRYAAAGPDGVLLLHVVRSHDAETLGLAISGSGWPGTNVYHSDATLDRRVMAKICRLDEMCMIEGCLDLHLDRSGGSRVYNEIVRKDHLCRPTQRYFCLFCRRGSLGQFRPCEQRSGDQ